MIAEKQNIEASKNKWFHAIVEGQNRPEEQKLDVEEFKKASEDFLYFVPDLILPVKLIQNMHRDKPNCL